jgi:hypothetical protein
MGSAREGEETTWPYGDGRAAERIVKAWYNLGVKKTMKIMVVDEHKKLLREPYVVRLGGWTLERYLEEAPEHPFCEFVRVRS